ncbi:hypothetical protein H6G33_10715 [Calothrix sp. FACHB-1219]|uniref:hypothetical protein n=1 Tax=unclassified Calothrix TaxID=2619626 RepID=UPI00168667C3|nr:MULTISPECIES: hypothetical protein [unclassified Calothrix]MBD2201820.1 hypothetical protein [Calothrix sp. FACHB-168]MBD2217506.1 hypothetical protein [Calothrix sp. FACHB-1219]
MSRESKRIIQEREELTRTQNRRMFLNSLPRKLLELMLEVESIGGSYKVTSIDFHELTKSSEIEIEFKWYDLSNTTQKYYLNTASEEWELQNVVDKVQSYKRELERDNYLKEISKEARQKAKEALTEDQLEALVRYVKETGVIN